METPKIIKYYVFVPSKYSAGIRGFEDQITVKIKSGYPGGQVREFEEYLRDCLNEWYDGGNVSILG